MHIEERVKGWINESKEMGATRRWLGHDRATRLGACMVVLGKGFQYPLLGGLIYNTFQTTAPNHTHIPIYTLYSHNVKSEGISGRKVHVRR